MHEPPFAEFTWAATPVVATAIHAGHFVPEMARSAMALPDGERLREEDPFTDRLVPVAEAHIVGRYSRFFVDVNRPRERAVYRTPEDAWGLRVWSDPEGPPEDVLRDALRAYDRFYERARDFFRRIRAERGRFVVLDLHSYRHRREGPDAPSAPASGNPEVNVGTGSLDRARWEPVVKSFVSAMSEPVRGESFDVRENVRFRGGHFSNWIHETFPDSGCSLAIELKKTFMDEWTGTLDPERLDLLGTALERAATAVGEAVDEAPARA